MQETYPIILSSDENYIKYASVLITSIIYNTNKQKMKGGGIISLIASIF
ncbi:hypothetical protein [Helicobacter winghamensis]|nr:hypothetical protein [Helicobacter winghamensis]